MSSIMSTDLVGPLIKRDEKKLYKKDFNAKNSTGETKSFRFCLKQIIFHEFVYNKEIFNLITKKYINF